MKTLTLVSKDSPGVEFGEATCDFCGGVEYMLCSTTQMTTNINAAICRSCAKQTVQFYEDNEPVPGQERTEDEAFTVPF